MKDTFAFILIFVLSALVGCKDDKETFQIQSCQDNGTIIDRQTNKNGKIYQIGDFWVIDIIIKDEVIRCAPCNLPDKLKNENRNIVLDANFYSTAPDVKTIGKPIELTKIY